MRKPTILECGAVLRNIREMLDAPGDRVFDRVELYWHESVRRGLRKRSAGGIEVAILQPPGQVLRHGDLIFADADLQIVVEFKKVEVIAAQPSGPADLAALAFEIGNLHLPIEIGNLELYVIPDGPMEELLERYDIPWTIQLRRFSPIFPPTRVTIAPAPQIIRTTA